MDQVCKDDDRIEDVLLTEDSWSDTDFDLVYPEWIQILSEAHWTPVSVAREAARLLVTKPGTRVLDIGCGPGKFCAVGALATEGHFTGVEQRGRLALIAQDMAHALAPGRIEIIHTNITEVNFGDYDAFYLYNPFQENAFPGMSIDDEVELLPDLFAEYTRHVKFHLARRPYGTRVVTYHGEEDAMPDSYRCESTSDDGLLNLWINRREHLFPSHAPAQEHHWEGGPFTAASSS